MWKKIKAKASDIFWMLLAPYWWNPVIYIAMILAVVAQTVKDLYDNIRIAYSELKTEMKWK